MHEMECPVCLGVRPGHIYECQNGHIICRECHDKLEIPRGCPSCQARMPEPPKRSLAIERLIERYDYK